MLTLKTFHHYFSEYYRGNLFFPILSTENIYCSIESAANYTLQYFSLSYSLLPTTLNKTTIRNSHKYVVLGKNFLYTLLFQLRIWFATKENVWKVICFFENFAAVSEILKRPQLWWNFKIFLKQNQKKFSPQLTGFHQGNALS